MKNQQDACIENIELSTIQPIPLNKRHGKPSDLFTIWFGSNIMLLTIITGAMAVQLFHLSFLWALIGLFIGSLIGGVFMALHSAQGPRLGVPQMVQTKGQFGSYGSVLVVSIVVLMYIGFTASSLVLGGQSIHEIYQPLSSDAGIIVVAILSLLATIFGYRVIHSYARAMSWVSGIILLGTFLWIAFVHGLPADFFTRNGYNTAGFLGAVSIAALWQLAYAPYVSDYSRYMPYNTNDRSVFYASYFGCILGSFLPMVLGILIASAISGDDIIQGIVSLTGGIAPLVIIVFALGIAATNSMMLYCGVLCTLTLGQTFIDGWYPLARARIITAIITLGIEVAIAIYGQDNFLVNYSNFITILLYVLVPWTAINLVDYYLVAHGDYDVASFFRRDGGIYGYFNNTAIFCYLLGIAVEIPFMSTTLYTGPVSKMLGGADVSWLIGLVVVSPVYYFMSKKRQAKIIIPEYTARKWGRESPEEG